MVLLQYNSIFSKCWKLMMIIIKLDFRKDYKGEVGDPRNVSMLKFCFLVQSLNFSILQNLSFFALPPSRNLIYSTSLKKSSIRWQQGTSFCKKAKQADRSFAFVFK